MKRSLIILLFISSLANAQDLTGTWEGYGRWFGAEYLKLVIIKCNGQYIGYSYDSGPGFCQANFAGTYNEDIKRLRGENKGMIRKTFEHTQSSFNLIYRKEGGVEYLEGQVGAKSTMFRVLSLGITNPVKIRKISNSVDTTAYMRACITDQKPKRIDSVRRAPDIVVIEQPKKADSVIHVPDIVQQPPVIEKKDTVIAIPAISQAPEIAIVKEKRTNDTVATVVTKESLIYISLYDNGQIDGDTITVFHNDKVIAERLGVNASPYKFTIAIDRNNPHHEIVLVANNLGSIPPNTAVVIIEAGDKRYNLFASSDLNKNSVVILRFQE